MKQQTDFSEYDLLVCSLIDANRVMINNSCLSEGHTKFYLVNPVDYLKIRFLLKEIEKTKVYFNNKEDE